MLNRIVLLIMAFVMLAAFSLRKKKWNDAELKEQKTQLGRLMFFDKKLSNPDGQSCTVCHAPKTSFSDPDHLAVSEGMLDGFFVNRNGPTLSYSAFVPPLHYDKTMEEWRGGLFWDGRSNSLEHQLSGPFFNIAEMNNADTAMLVAEVRNADYYKLYKSIYGKSKSDEEIYTNMTDAIATFERGIFINEFSSKFEFILDGKVLLNEDEMLGLALFGGKAKCSNCHSLKPQDGRVLFSDFSYHNLGVARNEANPFYTTDISVNPLGRDAIDLGLGAVVKEEKQNGKFRTPTLRNVQYTGPFFHNGAMESLEEVVHFINTRNHGMFAAPEVKENVENEFTGNLKLSEEEEQWLVAFLLALSDGYAVE